MSRFRLPVARGLLSLEVAAGVPVKAPRIDEANGIIFGASAMQAVEALGHGVDIDQTSLELLRDLGNALPDGAKSRFGHPGMCADAMGTALGRQKNFRIEGDKVVGDLHLSTAAAKSPRGDLRAYVLQLAKDDPAAFGMSVVVEAKRHWKLKDGGELASDDDSLRRRDGSFAIPANAVGARPFLRPYVFAASDTVDEPAANRSGMFSQFATGTSLDAAEAFDALDDFRLSMGFSIEQAQAFVAQYFTARSTTPKPKDIPTMRYSLAAFTAILLAHTCFAKELAEFDQDPKNKDATEADLKAYVVTLKAGAADAQVTTLRSDLATEKQGRIDDKAALQKEIDGLKTKLAAETKRANDLAALNQGSQAGNKVPGDTTAADLAGLSGSALYKAEFERSPKIRENFGQNLPAYEIHRKEQDAAKAKE